MTGACSRATLNYMLYTQRSIGATEVVGTASVNKPEKPIEELAMHPRLYHHLVGTLFLAVAALAAAWLFLFT
jgi:hypothetical protein